MDTWIDGWMDGWTYIDRQDIHRQTWNERHICWGFVLFVSFIMRFGVPFMWIPLLLVQGPQTQADPKPQLYI
jgi:hypothetical protein